MRGLLKTAMIAGLITAFVAPAYATDQNITLNATAAAFCKIGSTFSGSVTDPTPVDFTVTNGDVSTTTLTNAKTYAVVCNKASTVQLTSQSNGLKGPTSATGFDNVINYSATTGTFATASVATDGGSGPKAGTGVNVSTPKAANVTVSITPAANTDPLVAGSYTDTLTLSISPQ